MNAHGLAVRNQPSASSFRTLAAVVALAIATSAAAAAPVSGVQGTGPGDSGFATFLYVINGPKSGERFRAPSSLAVDQSNSLVYVCDSDDKAVLAFSFQGVSKFKIGEKGELDDPIAVAVDRVGNLYVSERRLRKVKIFDTRNELFAVIDLAKVEANTKVQPGKLAVTRDGEVLIVDQANQQILVFDQERHLKLKFGKVGDRIGEFRNIEDVAVDRQGRIYVADSAGIPIQVFDKRGQTISRIGARTDDGGLTNPVALTVDKFDQLWVVDSPNHDIKIFDRIGLLLRSFGEYGMVEQALFYPVDVGLDSMGRIYVLESGSRRLQVFELVDPYQPLTRR